MPHLIALATFQSAAEERRRGSRRFLLAIVIVFVSLTGILAANPAFGQTLRFALFGDTRSDMNGTGVNDQSVTAIANQISKYGNVQFAFDSGDLQCGEDVVFSNPPPTPPIPNPPYMATQFASFKADLIAGGLIPIGSPGTGEPVYCIRGNHETYDSECHDQIGAWMNAYGQYLPTNGPTTGAKGQSEVGMTYSFTSGNSLFLGVDEFCNATDAAFPIVNTAWVQQQIAARSDQKGYVFTFGHTPLYQIQ